MMRLVKQLAGIQDGGTTASPSFITGSPASNAGSSKNGQIVSKMGGDVVVECTGPILVLPPSQNQSNKLFWVTILDPLSRF